MVPKLQTYSWYIKEKLYLLFYFSANEYFVPLVDIFSILKM